MYRKHGAARARLSRSALKMVGLVAASMVVLAVPALADAPNPITSQTHGVMTINPNGTATVRVFGEWDWATHHSDCNKDRSGAGVGVIWRDPTEPGFTVAKGGISE